MNEEQPAQVPLWITDLDVMIALESVLINDEVVFVKDAHEICMGIRDKYEAALAAARQEIAQLKDELTQNAA